MDVLLSFIAQIVYTERVTDHKIIVACNTRRPVYEYYKAFYLFETYYRSISTVIRPSSIVIRQLSSVQIYQCYILRQNVINSQSYNYEMSIQILYQENQ